MRGMIEENVIKEMYLDHLNGEKRPLKVKASIQPMNPRLVKIHYEDGEVTTFHIHENHNSFMKLWGGFASWFLIEKRNRELE